MTRAMISLVALVAVGGLLGKLFEPEPVAEPEPTPARCVCPVCTCDDCQCGDGLCRCPGCAGNCHGCLCENCRCGRNCQCNGGVCRCDRCAGNPLEVAVVEDFEVELEPATWLDPSLPHQAVLFSATWCIPCQTAHEHAQRLRDSGWSVTELDYDADVLWRERLMPEALPCWIIFENGVEECRWTGNDYQQLLHNVRECVGVPHPEPQSNGVDNGQGRPSAGYYYYPRRGRRR